MLRRTDFDERGKPHLGLKDFFFVGAFLEENRSCQELNVEIADCFHTRTLGKSEGIVGIPFLTMAAILESFSNE